MAKYSRFWTAIGTVLLSVTALWVTPVLARDTCEMLGYSWSVTQSFAATAPPAIVVQAKQHPANAAAQTCKENVNGIRHRVGVKRGRTLVDAKIVGAERANKSWRHAGIITL